MRVGDKIDKLINNRFLKRLFRHFFYNEESVSLKFGGGGTYSDKTFYVIRVRYDNAGAMSYFRYVLSKCLAAEKRGFIPVVDMRDGINAYLEKDEIGKINTWEYFFEQPCQIGLEEIKNAKNLVYSSLHIEEPDSFYTKEVFDTAQKYIRFQPSILKRADSITCNWKDKYVLGVKLRGTDYVSTKPFKHARQPGLDEAIRIVDGVIAKINTSVDLIYLATEDMSIADGFRKYYGDRLFIMDIERFHPGEVWFETDRFQSCKRKQGEDYCVEIATLIRCHSLVASGSQGTIAARILNNGKYDYLEIIDKGTY